MKQILTLTTLLVFLFSGISYSQQPLKKVDKIKQYKKSEQILTILFSTKHIVEQDFF